LRSSVTPAWRAARYRPALGVRLNGRTGNLPLSGLAPDQSRAVSEAARQSRIRPLSGSFRELCTRFARASRGDFQSDGIEERVEVVPETLVEPIELVPLVVGESHVGRHRTE